MDKNGPGQQTNILKDFDWKLSIPLASDKLRRLDCQPLLNLNLYTAGSIAATSGELTRDEVGQLIKELTQLQESLANNKQ